MKNILVPYSEDFTKDYDTVDCENPHRVIDIWLKIKDIADFVEPEPCTVSDLWLCHSARIIQSVKAHEEVFAVARKAVGGAAMAAEACVSGDPSFALIRPPGHHAGHDFNGGFCFFNNMAIAVTKLISEKLVRNALIVDIDLHYGNGTFDIVKEEPKITFRNISAPTRARFFEDLEKALADAARFDIVGCSAGFDTYVKDWGALLNTGDYRQAGNLLARSNPHFFSVLEGGYFIDDLGENVLAYLKGIQEACS